MEDQVRELAFYDELTHLPTRRLLVEVAKRMKACVRSIDTVSRFGGDEFVVLLSDFGLNKAETASQARHLDRASLHRQHRGSHL